MPLQGQAAAWQGQAAALQAIEGPGISMAGPGSSIAWPGSSIAVALQAALQGIAGLAVVLQGHAAAL